MTAPTDIREWADREGVDLSGEPTYVDNDGTRYIEKADEAEGSVAEEVAPRIPEPSVADRASEAVQRLRKLPDKFNPAKRNRGSSGGSQARSKPARKVRGPRVPVDSIISTIWEMGSKVMQPIMWPVANVLKAQAPVAGLMLEDIVKNTAVDRVLQPLARVGNGGEMAFALMAPPVLVGLVSAKPETQNVVLPILRQSLRSWIRVAGPKLEQVAQEEKEFEEKYGAAIDVMIAAFFTPPEGMGDTPKEG